jgi:isocitrate dehydrogenase (NAD+)
MSSQSEGSREVVLIPGDGIGPEVTEAAVGVLEALGAGLEWQRVEAGAEVVAKYGAPLPDEVRRGLEALGYAE